jgi:hypothetical protein
LLLTNYAKAIGANDTNYINSVGLLLTNFAKGIGAAVTNWGNTTFVPVSSSSNTAIETDAAMTLSAGTGGITLSSTDGVSVSGGLTVSGGMSGSASGLTALNASSISLGTLNSNRLPPNVVTTNANNAFLGSNYVANAFRVLSNFYVGGTVFGNGAGWTNLDGAQLQNFSVGSNAFNSATANILFTNRAFSGLSFTNGTNFGTTFYMPGMAVAGASILLLNPNYWRLRESGLCVSE